MPFQFAFCKGHFVLLQVDFELCRLLKLTRLVDRQFGLISRKTQPIHLGHRKCFRVQLDGLFTATQFGEGDQMRFL